MKIEETDLEAATVILTENTCGEDMDDQLVTQAAELILEARANGVELDELVCLQAELAMVQGQPTAVESLKAMIGDRKI